MSIEESVIELLTEWIEAEKKKGHALILKHVACSICDRCRRAKKIIKEIKKEDKCH